MLEPHAPTGALWSGQCSGCLAPIPVTPGTRAEAEVALQAAGWELRSSVMIWCVACSRRAREVPFPATQRGQRKRRRW